MKFKNFKLDEMFLFDSGFLDVNFKSNKTNIRLFRLINRDELKYHIYSYSHKVNSVEQFIENDFKLDFEMVNRVFNLYNKSRLSGVPVEIILEDMFPSVNPDDFSYRKHSKYGVMNVVGRNNFVGGGCQIDKMVVRSSLQGGSTTLCHELGHLIDYAVADDYHFRFSDSSNFNSTYDKYQTKLMEIDNRYHFPVDEVEYLSRRREVFAYMFNRYFYEEIEPLFSSNARYDPFKDSRMTGDFVANEIYDNDARELFNSICLNLKYDDELSVNVNKSLSDKELLSKFESIVAESLYSFNDKDNDLDINR